MNVPMGLLADIEAVGPTVVAFVGPAKNCGKTTAMLHVAAGCRAAGIRVGLTSAGRDGEETDAITLAPKPRVAVWPGMIVATAREALAEATGAMREVQATGLPTAMGEIVIAEARGEGLVELAGPVTLAQCGPVLSAMRGAGARRILVDGALDRLAVATPRVADAVVLSVGAVLGATVADVVRKARHHVELLTLPLAGTAEGRADWPKEPLSANATLVSRDGRRRELPASALRCSDRGFWTGQVGPDTVAVVAGGAVTDELLEGLLSGGWAGQVVGGDGTRMMVSPVPLARWRSAGGTLAVLEQVRLVALTSNPHNPTGTDLDGGELLAGLRRAVPFPVHDVMMEGA